MSIKTMSTPEKLLFVIMIILIIIFIVACAYTLVTLPTPSKATLDSLRKHQIKREESDMEELRRFKPREYSVEPKNR